MNPSEYGAKYGVAKVLLLAASGMLILALILLAAGVAVLGVAIANGVTAGKLVIGIVLLIVGGLVMAYVVKTLRGNVTCYENAIVITETFKTIVIPRDQIAAIQWQRPGATASNDKMRTNVNKADIILTGGRKHYEISDGYYSNVDIIGTYQSQFKIPMEIKR